MAFPRTASILLLLSAAAPAAIFHRGESVPSERGPAISLRKRIHVNTLITPPDAVELEYGGSFSWDGSFTLPMTLHYTPEGRYVWWGRTEFSVGFDTISHDSAAQFGDRVNLAATCVVHDGDKLDIAVQPLASLLLRGDSGARIGATGIARYDGGRSSAGVTFSWNAATHSSPTNPAGVFDIGLGYGYQLSNSGPLSHLTPHVNAVYEKATGTTRQISLFEGIEYQVTNPFSIDFSFQHIALWGGQTANQFIAGITLYSPKLHHR
uniref:Transporter n=1 Tax=Solibacter usitatus (strain Ellin6076) TaxID=234267 RepID=Q024D5_SOLUE